AETVTAETVPAAVVTAETVPATAVPAETLSAQTVPAGSQAPDPVTEAVLSVVEGLTGDPRELLDLDLDLEADLGGDTGKQAEGFAAVRERFAIPRPDDLKLRAFPPLAPVIGFVHDHEKPAPQAAGCHEAAGSPEAAGFLEAVGFPEAAKTPAEPTAASAGPAETGQPGADQVTEAVLG